MATEPLPSKPNLEFQHKLAKRLVRHVWANEPDAIARVRAFHPKPPHPDAMTLRDAQWVIARGYGFESWAAMKGKIDSLTRTPLELFDMAVRSGDAESARELLQKHAAVRAAINKPVTHTSMRLPFIKPRRTCLWSMYCRRMARISMRARPSGQAASASLNGIFR